MAVSSVLIITAVILTIVGMYTKEYNEDTRKNLRKKRSSRTYRR